MTTAQNIIDRATKLGISAKLWQKAGRLRIYASTDRRDISVYLDLDGTVDHVEGARFQVFCNTEQHPNWIKAQIKQYREDYIGLFYSYVFEAYKDVGPQPNAYSPEINAMIDVSRVAVAAREAEMANDTE